MLCFRIWLTDLYFFFQVDQVYHYKGVCKINFFPFNFLSVQVWRAINGELHHLMFFLAIHETLLDVSLNYKYDCNNYEYLQK